MATIPIIGKVTVDGTAKNISGGYVNIGGVWKPIVKTYVNIGGVWKPAWKELYTWKKYLVADVEGAPYTEKENSTTQTQSFSENSTTTVYYASKYTFNTSTGKFALTSPTTSTLPSLSSNTYYSTEGKSGLSSIQYCQTKRYYSSSRTWKVTYIRHFAKGTITQAMGDYVEDVTSEDPSTYPDDGIHSDGYWYVKQ